MLALDNCVDIEVPWSWRPPMPSVAGRMRAICVFLLVFACPGISDAQTADNSLQQQIDLLQEQTGVLEGMVQLLVEDRQQVHAEARPDVEFQLAELEARNRQAAVRDQELVAAVNDLGEQFDAERRQGPTLPGTLRELFLPHRTHESPLGVYGTLSTGFSDFENSNSNFGAPTFSPHFYLLLNEHVLLEANPEFKSDTSHLESAQLDWFVHDNLTIVLGKFYTPLGFLNERLHTSWIIKTPDKPLMFKQVFPSASSMQGVQFKGARYFCDWPVKVEYMTVLSNGFSLDGDVTDPLDRSDLAKMESPTSDVNNDLAVGGRLGLALPELGIIAGVSGLGNGAYDAGGRHDLSALVVDFSWHDGNWDFRFEYASVDQQAPGAPIDREGFYAQLAHRDYDSYLAVWQKIEIVGRYDRVNFSGIDPAVATAISTGPSSPLDRERYSAGLNHYFYPSLIAKLHYIVSNELNSAEIDDNGLLFQVTWGF